MDTFLIYQSTMSYLVPTLCFIINVPFGYLVILRIKGYYVVATIWLRGEHES
jgi:hypothetical protein